MTLPVSASTKTCSLLGAVSVAPLTTTSQARRGLAVAAWMSRVGEATSSTFARRLRAVTAALSAVTLVAEPTSIVADWPVPIDSTEPPLASVVTTTSPP